MFDYRFFVNDFDRIKNYKKQYPKAGLIFNYPSAFWFGVKQGKAKNTNLFHRVNRLLDRAYPRIPILVIYNIPDRDIGQHSAGGASNSQEYLNWITVFAKAIGDRKPIVVFEPDALPHSTLHPESQQTRLELMRQALEILTEHSNAYVYVDIGHSNWLDPETAGALLEQVTNENIRGFSVNVSNYRTTKESMNWALRVGEYTKNKHFVIDTSRNGNGPYGNDWCNPPGRALGHPPTVYTRHELCDAYLWIKVPGESDGLCNGGPNAGTFWLEYARDLVDNTQWLDQ